MGMENNKAFTWSQVKGGIKLTIAVEIPAFKIEHVQGLSQVRGHQQCVNTITEPPTEKYLNSITTVMTFTCLKPRSACVAVGLCSLTGNNIILKPNMVVAKISAAYVAPYMLVHNSPVGNERQADNGSS